MSTSGFVNNQSEEELGAIPGLRLPTPNVLTPTLRELDDSGAKANSGTTNQSRVSTTRAHVVTSPESAARLRVVPVDDDRKEAASKIQFPPLTKVNKPTESATVATKTETEVESSEPTTQTESTPTNTKKIVLIGGGVLAAGALLMFLRR